MVLRRKRCVSVATEGRERLHTGDVWWQCIPYSWTSNWKHMVAKCALRCHSKPCSVSGKVALMSQYNDLPLCNGTSVRPSGLIQSDRNNLTASLVTGVGGGSSKRHHWQGHTGHDIQLTWKWLFCKQISEAHKLSAKEPQLLFFNFTLLFIIVIITVIYFVFTSNKYPKQMKNRNSSKSGVNLIPGGHQL